MLLNCDKKYLSYFFALVSKISYQEKFDDDKLKKLGFVGKIFENSGSEVWIFENDYDLVISCRGTEIKELSDIAADLKTWPKKSKIGDGLVHDGFDDYVEKIWLKIVGVITGTNKNIWFTGHSLGAAMSSLMAIYCRIDPNLANPAGLYTYGSPRVGNKTFIKQCDFFHERWVNNIDIVTKIPPLLFGYRHFGKLMYFNHYGNKRNLSFWQMLKDRFRGVVTGLRKGKINYFVNHEVDRYLDNLRNFAEDHEWPQS